MEILVIISIIHSLIVLLVLSVGIKKGDEEKNSSYECGFQAFPYHKSLDVSGFATAIAFLRFDRELIMLLPWIKEPVWNYSIFIFFLLLVLTLAIGKYTREC